MDPIAGWLIDNAMSARTLAELLDGVCQQLTADGLPILRANISLSVIDPVFRARSCTWRSSGGTEDGAIPHDREDSQFATSPIGAMFAARQTLRHWLIDDASRREFRLLEEIATQGATDYLAILHPFDSRDFAGLRGVGFTIASSRPGGLLAAEQARVRAIADVLAPIIYRITLGDIAVALMDAYVGAPASRRILHGQVQRGVGEPIDAVLLLADLRGFTAVADTSGLDLIERLDEHLEAMAAPVIARGGSVLKFLGDGMLAVFPIGPDVSKAAACRLALEAANDAIGRTAVVNGRRRSEEPLHLDVALNYGEVFYGNVGAPGRLDFTVIGPAVNAVSRMEAMCGPLDRNLLMSGDVANDVGVPTVSLGSHKLRGIEAEHELFTTAARIDERGG